MPHATPFPPYKRIPHFLPVPLRGRADGWSPERQACFIGWLAETGSVKRAARKVGCSREGAYRLRRRAGSASFVHAWDAVLGIRAGGDIPPRKVTPDELWETAMRGPYRVVMRRGRFCGARRKPCSFALLRLLSAYDRSTRMGGEA